MKNTLALNLRMQQLFKDWANMTPNSHAPDFTAYPHLYSFLSRAHVELARKKSWKQALRGIEKNCRMLEDVVRVWFLKAVEDTMSERLPEIKKHGRLNPYAISLNPSRWAQDGLFEAEPSKTRLMETDIKHYCGDIKPSGWAKAIHLFRLYLWAWKMRTSSPL